MRIKSYKIVCIILIVFVIVSGMCFEGVKTHSTFACASIKEPNVYSISFDIVFRDGDFCTAEVLEIRNYIHKSDGKKRI